MTVMGVSEKEKARLIKVPENFAHNMCLHSHDIPVFILHILAIINYKFCLMFKCQ